MIECIQRFSGSPSQDKGHTNKIKCKVIFFFFVFLLFFGPLPRHMEVPRLGVELEL